MKEPRRPTCNLEAPVTYKQAKVLIAEAGGLAVGSLLLWYIIAVLLVLWLLSFLVAHLGGILHLLLVLALVLIVVNLARGRGTSRTRVHRRL